MNDVSRDIICLSHLPWDDTLFQRPQQLMLRFANNGYRVFYIAQCSLKEHLFPAQPRCGHPDERLWHWRLPGMIGPQNPKPLKAIKINWLVRRIGKLMRQFEIDSPILWIYYPEYYPVATQVDYGKLVYDCMDPFDHFRRTGRSIEQNESALAKLADCFFIGGESMHREKQRLNSRCASCFPSGIDVEHFHRAMQPETEVPPDIAALEKPVFGYFGAIDERIDWRALRTLADRLDTGSIVLLGPKVGGTEPPFQHPRLHLPGARPYAELPGCLKGFDVCLIPFVLNALTERLSPTKTPEYLAGGKPVVSTSLPDVRAQYGDIIAIAENAESFADACLLMAANPPDPEILFAGVRKLSWDAIVDEMERLILESKEAT
ncbi:hypothetical protein JXA32_15175 [Candidatus Sumerlaeota bacterium]|nr:hypothetical protein [Candidatus Sumerlaeota bacterium]